MKMKSHWILLPLLLFFTHLKAQTYVFELHPAQYGTGSSVSDITEMTNGRIAAMIDSAGYNAVVQLTPMGHVVRTLNLSGDRNNNVGNLRSLPNGDLLQYGHSGYTRRGSFIRRDSLGVVERDTFLRESSWSGAPMYVYDAITDNSGNTYYVGHIYDIFSGGVSFYSWRIPVIGKLNSNMAMVWTKTISSHTSSNKRKGSANALAFDSDGNILAYGGHSHGTGGTGKDFLVKFNPGGTTIWSREKPYGSGGYTSPNALVSSSTGSTFIFKAVSGSTGENGVRVEKFNKAGVHQWARTYSNSLDDLTFRDFGINDDGEIYMAGTYYTNLTKGAVMKIDTNGNFISASTVNMSANWGTSFNCLEIMDDDYVMVGGAVGGVPVLVRMDTSASPLCSSSSLSMVTDTINASWSTGVNLGGKGLTYYNSSFSGVTSMNTSVDSSCFLGPPCDVFLDVTLNDTLYCQGETVMLTNNSAGTSLNIYWYMDTTFLGSDATFDTLLGVGTYDFYQVGHGLYCSDTIHVQVVVNPVDDDTIRYRECVGDSIVFNQMTFTADTNITTTFANVYGCDSVVRYELRFVSPYYNYQQTICSNETYSFGGNTLNTAGTYYDTLSSSLGCDSVVELDLSVLHVPQSTFSQTICYGDTASFNGQHYHSTGTYDQVYNASNGCDSLSTLNLTVLPLNLVKDTAVICDGGSYTFNGQILTTEGLYYDTLVAANGCDSIQELDLQLSDVEAKVGIFGDSLKSIFTHNLYEWIRCSDNGLIGIYTSYYVPSNTDFYALVGYDAQGCTDTSACFNIPWVGLEFSDPPSVRIYPNPASDHVVILGLEEGEIQIEWISVEGKVVDHVESISGIVPTPSIPGMYLMRFELDGSIHQARVVVGND